MNPMQENKETMQKPKEAVPPAYMVLFDELHKLGYEVVEFKVLPNEKIKDNDTFSLTIKR